jgi:hypothetical protein
MRIASITVFLAACATTTTTSTPKGGPRGLRASEHREVAAQHDEQARERSTWPDRSMVAGAGPDTRDQPIAMPWYRSWDTAAEHERLASFHRSKAAELEAAYAEACGEKPGAEVTVSPLARYGLGGWPTANTVIVYLSPSVGTADQLLAALKCHRAFMMLAPADMDDCPLDLPGLQVDARGDTDGITVSLSVKDPALIPELKRRTAHDLEAGQHQDLGMSVHKENGQGEHRP